MAAYIDDDDDDDDLWELAASYEDIFPSRRPRLFQDRANPLTDLDEVEFRAWFPAKKQIADLLTARLCKQLGNHDNNKLPDRIDQSDARLQK